MPDLFIANGTHQHQDFHYRIPEIKQSRQQRIAIGGQIRISGDLTQPQVDAIIEQHRKYGLIDANDILKGRGPCPLAFRVGRHITQDEIIMLTQRNRGELIERGEEMRKDMAQVLGNQLGQAATESGTGAEFAEASVEVIEETRKGEASGEKLEQKTIIERTDRVTKSANKNKSKRR